MHREPKPDSPTDAAYRAQLGLRSAPTLNAHLLGWQREAEALGLEHDDARAVALLCLELETDPLIPPE